MLAYPSRSRSDGEAIEEAREQRPALEGQHNLLNPNSMEMLEVARRSHIREPLAQMSGGEQFWERAVRRSATAEDNYLGRGLMEGRCCKSSNS
jgi:hypothetical protein